LNPGEHLNSSADDAKRVRQILRQHIDSNAGSDSKQPAAFWVDANSQGSILRNSVSAEKFCGQIFILV
jgi:hypothetical protein